MPSVPAIKRAPWTLVVPVAVLLAPTVARAQSEPPATLPSESEQRLRAEIDAERRAREALEARVVAREKQAEPPATAAPPIAVVSGYVHMDWVVHRQSSQNEVTPDGQPLNEDRFLLRRARLRAERDHGLLHGALEIDANTINGPQLRPVNAEVSVKWPARRPYARAPWAYDAGATARTPRDGWVVTETNPEQNNEPWFMVTAGLFRTPFGFEVPESERQRPWLERTTMSNALFPQSFDLGVRVVGGFKFVRYALGVMNGEPMGTRTFPGRDPNETKDLVFRLGGASAVTDTVRIEGGLSGVTGRGFHGGLAATKDVIQWQDSNDDGVVDPSELELSAGSPATPSQSFKRFAVGADLRASIVLPLVGELAIRAEIVRAQNLDRGLFVSDPIVATRDLRQLGWYLGVSQELTRWALIGIRYDRYDPDADAREQAPFAIVPRDQGFSTWSFSAAGRVGFGRLVAQYDHRKNPLGRDASGAPTTLADDSFTLRAEARF